MLLWFYLNTIIRLLINVFLSISSSCLEVNENYYPSSCCLVLSTLDHPAALLLLRRVAPASPRRVPAAIALSFPSALSFPCRQEQFSLPQFSFPVSLSPLPLFPLLPFFPVLLHFTPRSLFSPPPVIISSANSPLHNFYYSPRLPRYFSPQQSLSVQAHKHFKHLLY